MGDYHEHIGTRMYNNLYNFMEITPKMDCARELRNYIGYISIRYHKFILRLVGMLSGDNIPYDEGIMVNGADIIVVYALHSSQPDYLNPRGRVYIYDSGQIICILSDIDIDDPRINETYNITIGKYKFKLLVCAYGWPAARAYLYNNYPELEYRIQVAGQS